MNVLKLPLASEAVDRSGELRLKPDELVKLWDTIKDTHPDIVSGRVSNDLHTQLSLPICTLTAEGSAFFKHHYRANWNNKGIMERE